MYCPECKTEYREGFRECADCGVPLVATLPQTEKEKYIGNMPADSSHLVTVFQTGDCYDFVKAAEALEQAGIPFCGRERYTGEFTAAKLAPPPYAWTLLAPAECAEAALRILGEQMNCAGEEEYSDETAEDTEQFPVEVKHPAPVPRPAQSRIVTAGDGPFRKVILLLMVCGIIGAIIMSLRN